MLFPNSTIEELTSDKIYEFPECKSVYLVLLDYYHRLLDSPSAQEDWSQSDDEERNHELWWVMNEAWKEYGTANPDLPYRWLAITKRALHWDHIPINFYPVALAILEKFDLDRYQSVYHLPTDEYEAMRRDLPEVLDALRNYPSEKLAPPMDEDNWGYTDQ